MKKFAFTLMELMLIFFILAIIAILFYRTLKPDRIVFQKLYSSAYSQMEEAYQEVLAYSEIQGKEVYTVYSEDKFLRNYPPIFFKIVNYIGEENAFQLGNQNIFYNEANAYYEIQPNMQTITFPAHLSNNMQIRFDLGELQNQLDVPAGINRTDVLIATMDINGDALPNLINKDIIQFEINEKGIFPVGDIETNINLLKYAVVSKYKDNDINNNTPIMGDEKIIKSGLSYDVAACYAGAFRHAYYAEDKDCGEINVITPDCMYSQLPCRVKVLKY
ncbi:hypothetical protein J6Q66_03980 [bacterium]|nr:hypothetical protein [bacterium]